MEDIRDCVRVADISRQALFRLKGNQYAELLRQLKSFANQLQEMTSESKKMGLSLVRGWFSAADRCCKMLNRSLCDASYSVSLVKQLTDRPCKDVPKLSFLVAELKQLRQEFGNIDYGNEHSSISVMTEPISLDDVYLGPFKIELHLDRLKDLYRDSPYFVMALDPHPAATSEDVIHPHVTSEKLCEGDGVATIRTALEEGRLCDFFTMVRSILNTYNPDSAYISLSDWEGEPCYDCGYVTDSENSYYCHFCDRSFCEECSTCCRNCDETVCLGCTVECEACEEPVCPRCARIRCIECERICCELCIDKGLCPDCEQERKKENEEQEESMPNQSETGSSEIKLTTFEGKQRAIETAGLEIQPNSVG
jgi:hypothetical protein